MVIPLPGDGSTVAGTVSGSAGTGVVTGGSALGATLVIIARPVMGTITVAVLCVS